MIAHTDTIVALSTPSGRSGIGVIRLSGPDSLAILRKLVASDSFDPEPNVLTLRSLIDPTNDELLDQALVCYFKKPHSFTGEDVVELHCHGSPILLRSIIDATLGLGARLAGPGEFSLRAVANERLKLTEAEAIRDLIDAQTDAGVRQATRQMKGEISNTLQPAKDELLKIIVRLECSLEFVEDDLPPLETDQLRDSLQQLIANLERLANTFSRGRLIREGIKVTFVGRPNVGKSSLFNGLLGHGRAIVTEVPGTTRDAITESIAIDGVPVVLTDTAGLRVSEDQIESIGIDKTKREAADSDLLVVVIDGAEPLTDEDRKVMTDIAGQPHIVAINKSDLPTFSATRVNDEILSHNQPQIISVSAKTNGGLERLRTAILESFKNGDATAEGLLITNARHHDLLRCAVEAVKASEELLKTRASEELILVGLHNALRFLGEITGETTSDEILGRIFSTFCIGK
ncbi:MAG TPA: tRNA uridine-5-carboxymethylaminomethyl(34) synthesis GTPase MnmE [Pyrinomonadaceae bacterium]|nr:tRNA uridine-5-carboxymethylaminomethyl(34) synthesis GTPase MnmE [Pyrinomonadaceae bacterium]